MVLQVSPSSRVLLPLEYAVSPRLFLSVSAFDIRAVLKLLYILDRGVSGEVDVFRYSFFIYFLNCSM